MFALFACPPGAADQLPASLSDAEVTKLGAPTERVPAPVDAVVLTPQAGADPPVRDPRDSARYTAACYTYVAEHGRYFRRFAVHVPDRDLLPFAQRAARYLAVLWWAVSRRAGTTMTGLRRETVHVWLSQTGDGGAQDRNSIFVYGLLADRSGIEWARELAHEYGHYLLPGASGYAEPENWANGVLGERLFLRWLRDDVGSGRLPASSLPYVDLAGLSDYCDRQVTPLVTRLRQLGPDPAILKERTAQAMDAFTGVLLYADETYGPAVLAGLLDYLPAQSAAGARGPDFLAAATAWVRGQPAFDTTLPGSEVSMIYVPAGTYDVRGEPKPGRSLTLAGASVAAGAAGWVVRVPSSSWRRTRVSGAGLVVLHWRRRAPGSTDGAQAAQDR